MGRRFRSRRCCSIWWRSRRGRQNIQHPTPNIEHPMTQARGRACSQLERRWPIGQSVLKSFARSAGFLGLSGNIESGNDKVLLEFACGDEGAVSELGQVVFAGVSDAVNETVFAQSPKQAPDLAGVVVAGQGGAEATVGPAADGGFTPEHGQEQLLAGGGKEVEAAPTALFFIPLGAGDLIEVVPADAWIFEPAQPAQVALAGGCQKPLQGP